MSIYTTCDICGRKRLLADMTPCSLCRQEVCSRCDFNQRNADGRRVGHEQAEHYHELQRR